MYLGKIALSVLGLFITFGTQAQVSKTIESTAGTLSTALSPEEKNTVTHLTLTGSIDARDFKTLRDSMNSLSHLDINGAMIVTYSGTDGTVASFKIYAENEVPESSFSGKSSMISIDLPENLAGISSNAFLSCSNLNTVELPLGMKKIGYRGFGWSGLNTIALPPALEYIGEGAFATTNINEIEIPAQVNYIGPTPFYQCCELSSIAVDGNNVHYSSIDGVLFSNALPELIQYPNGKMDTVYHVPEGVQKISARSFDGGNPFLKKLYIPEGVTDIGTWAFVNLHQLVLVELPASLESLGNGAFFGNSTLQCIIIHREIPVSINADVFNFVDKNTCILYVPYGSKTAYEATDPWNTFQHIVEIGNPFEMPLQVTAGELAALLPQSVRDTMTYLALSGTIDARDFKTMRDSLPELKYVNIDDVEILAYQGTEGPYSTPLFYSYGQDAIPIYSFLNCQKLTRINLPQSVTSIETHAFGNCPSLERVYVSSTIVSIKDRAFSGCKDGIEVDENNPMYSSLDGILFNKEKTILIQAPITLVDDYEIPTTVAEIKAWSFFYCRDIVTLKIPSSVVSIGDYAFRNCQKLIHFHFEGNAPITFGNNVFIITLSNTNFNITYNESNTGFTTPLWNNYPCFPLSDNKPHAYAGKDITINEHSSVQLNGNGSFDFSGLPLTYSWKVPSLITISADTIISPWITVPEFFSDTLLTITLEVSDGINISSDDLIINIKTPEPETYFIFDSISGTIVKYIGNKTKIVIPDKLNNTSVLTIGKRAFYDCQSITDLEIKANLTEIGDSAFFHCHRIKALALPRSVNKIGNSAFSYCLDLSTIYLPKQLQIIKKELFSGCRSLKNIILPDSLKEIEEFAFGGCSNLMEVLFPQNILKIGDNAFYKCSTLSHLDFPKELQFIGQSAFFQCTSLHKVVFSSKLDTIGSSAFYECSSLKMALFSGNAPGTFGNVVFSKTHSDFKILYNSTSSGFTTPTWKGYPCFPLSEFTPLAIAGPDQTVPQGSLLTLDGARSSDPGNLPLAYHWTAPEGIELSSDTAQKPTFTAPVLVEKSQVHESEPTPPAFSSQVINTEPFISEVVFRAYWSTTFIEVVNPGNEPIDLSHYMLVFTIDSPTDAISLYSEPDSVNWSNRYKKYVPGKIWSEKNDWLLQPALLYDDPSISSIVGPKQVFTIGGSNLTNANHLLNRADVQFKPTDDSFNGTFKNGTSNSIYNLWTSGNIYLYKIMNDSVCLGIKPAIDPADFQLIDAFGLGNTADWYIAGTRIDQNYQIIRKSSIGQGNTALGSSFGTNPEDSDWQIYNDQYYTNKGYSWPQHIDMLASNLGTHQMDDFTVILSTVTSPVYLVSEGDSFDERIGGIAHGTNGEIFLNNLIKGNPGQTLTLIDRTTGQPKSLKELIQGGDSLLVTSANGLNQTKYILGTVGTSEALVFTLTVDNGIQQSAPDTTVVIVQSENPNDIPFAILGPDQVVQENTQVQLNGSQSYDPDGTPLTFSWTTPEEIVLNDPSAPNPTFTAPSVNLKTYYRLVLTVSDGTHSQSAEMKVTVTPDNAPLAVMMRTTKASGSEFYFSVSCNIPSQIQVDWGNGVLVNYEIYNQSIFNLAQISGTCASDHAEIKIYAEFLNGLNCEQMQLDSIDVTQCTGLQWLKCSANQIREINLHYNPHLSYLDIGMNHQLANLDVSINWNLYSLICQDCNLDSLDLSNNTSLHDLNCEANHLTNLDFSTNTNIYSINCAQNLLASLSMQGLTNLNRLYCHGNLLDACSLDDLFRSLHDNTGNGNGNIYIKCSLSANGSNPGMNTCSTTLANNRNWKVMDFDGNNDSPEFEGDGTGCPINQAPIANAGPNQIVDEGTIVTLDGSASTDPDNEPLTYLWTASTGITLSSDTVSNPTFTAPEVNEINMLRFTLVVNDGTSNSQPDTVYVKILNIIETQHFTPVWTGNGVDHMNLNVVTALQDLQDLQAGDEIGVFDGNLCVGVGVLTAPLSQTNVLPIAVSRNDGSGNGYTVGHDITYKFYDQSAGKEFSPVTPTYNTTNPAWSSDGKFAIGATAFIDLTAVSTIVQQIPLTTGWNIFSSNVTPADVNLKNIVQPLITASQLRKVMDEAGKIIEDWGTFGGWQNTIGNLAVTQGYKINVTAPCTLSVEGTAVVLPLDIPLNAGWNIIGYPAQAAQNAKDAVQALIDAGNLIKVMNEAGASIEDWGAFGGWVNNIGNFTPGKGYKINVASTCTLTVEEPALKSAVISAEDLQGGYCRTYRTCRTGNGYNQMNINLYNIAHSGLNAGDEVAVFDGTLCVGALSLSPANLVQNQVSLVATAHDGLSKTLNGFTEGHPVVLKLLRQGREIQLTPGEGQVFVQNGSLFVDLSLLTANIKFENEAGFECYPNPFNKQLTIEMKNLADRELNIAIFDVAGRKVAQVYQGTNPGTSTFTWQRGNTRAGAYFCKVNGMVKKIVITD